VRGIVQRMQTTGSLRPFDLAKGAMNFWMAFVPSRQRGTSPLYDLNPSPFGAKFFGAETPMAVKPEPAPTPPPVGPPEAPKPYTIENLVYQVGLPTPADSTVLAADARTNWIARYGPDIGPRVSDDLYLDWLDLRDHRLANEVDNAFGLGNGNRPVMHERDPAKVADFHPLRTTRAHLDTFLRNLRVGTVTGPAIGAIWATKSPAIPDPAGAGLPAGLQNGQDSTFVFMLCGGTPFCGVQKSGLIVSSLRNETAARLVPVAGTRRLDFDPYDLPVGAPLAIGSRVAHEIAHSFGLKDEYGEFATLRIPATEEKGLKSQGNVQPASELERSAADRRLDPAKLGKIKWLWPRVDRAGVLAAPPAAAAAGFTITLARGHGRGFRQGNLVRLRLRPLSDDPSGTSGRLRIDDVTGDVVTAAQLDGPAIAPAGWPAGSILIRPVRGAPTPGDRNGADLPLVAPIIAGHLATSFLPLDLTPGGPPPPACARDERDVQIPANLPAGLPLGRPRYRAQIVGLYDNGARYFCGVYHPSGACLMRTQEPITDPVTKRLTTYLLCPVCRYWLVDRLDPTQHAAIDDDYAKRYPQP
jgi:hypothetical protein